LLQKIQKPEVDVTSFGTDIMTSRYTDFVARQGTCCSYRLGTEGKQILAAFDCD